MASPLKDAFLPRSVTAREFTTTPTLRGRRHGRSGGATSVPVPSKSVPDLTRCLRVSRPASGPAHYLKQKEIEMDDGVSHLKPIYHRKNDILFVEFPTTEDASKAANILRQFKVSGVSATIEMENCALRESGAAAGAAAADAQMKRIDALIKSHYDNPRKPGGGSASFKPANLKNQKESHSKAKTRDDDDDDPFNLGGIKDPRANRELDSLAPRKSSPGLTPVNMLCQSSRSNLGSVSVNASPGSYRPLTPRDSDGGNGNATTPIFPPKLSPESAERNRALWRGGPAQPIPQPPPTSTPQLAKTSTPRLDSTSTPDFSAFDDQSKTALLGLADLIEAQWRRLDASWQELDQSRRRLDQDRQTLEKERQTLDRERRAVEQQRQALDRDRKSWERDRRSLESEKLRHKNDAAVEWKRLSMERRLLLERIVDDDAAEFGTRDVRRFDDANLVIHRETCRPMETAGPAAQTLEDLLRWDDYPGPSPLTPSSAKNKAPMSMNLPSPILSPRGSTPSPTPLDIVLDELDLQGFEAKAAEAAVAFQSIIDRNNNAASGLCGGVNESESKGKEMEVLEKKGVEEGKGVEETEVEEKEIIDQGESEGVANFLDCNDGGHNEEEKEQNDECSTDDFEVRKSEHLGDARGSDDPPPLTVIDDP